MWTDGVCSESFLHYSYDTRKLRDMNIRLEISETLLLIPS
jgi:hypothetical protein